MDEFQLQDLNRLNKRLIEVEKGIKQKWHDLVAMAEAELSKPDRWANDYEIEGKIFLQLRWTDAGYNEHDDNMVAELFEIPNKHHKWHFGLADGQNHNEFMHWVNHPMKDEFHCWVYHCLYDHAHLGWEELLRIGEIWIDMSVIYQKFVSVK